MGKKFHLVKPPTGKKYMRSNPKREAGKGTTPLEKAINTESKRIEQGLKDLRQRSEL
jgi:hypothetical protein